jgi:hypothetical protein
MRIPNEHHTARAWRIREIAPDFEIEDVWALPVQGAADDLSSLIALMTSADPPGSGSVPARILWRVRDLLGSWFGLGRISVAADGGGALPIPGASETSLRDRLPDDLRGTASDVVFHDLPFTPLYRTDREFAAEISNRTVHGILHLAWVELGAGRYQGQMTVYVKPRGRLGAAYMTLIKPFRYLVVYPALMRQIEREWKARPA